MKQLILFLLVFIYSTQGMLSQETELKTDQSPQELEDYYTMKFKKKKRTAWILLGAGVGTMVLATTFTVATMGYGYEIGVVAFGIGAASTIASIPFFIKAHSFKKKAAASSSFQVSFGTISMPKRNNLALGISYNF